MGNVLSKAVKRYLFGNISDNEVRERMYNNLLPWGYHTPIKRVRKTVKRNQPEHRGNVYGITDDVFAEYLQIPKNKRREPALNEYLVTSSKYTPQKSSENKLYKTIQGLHMDTDRGQSIRDEIINKAPKTIGENVVTSTQNLIGPFGDFTIGRGFDDRGEYVSYYDSYDINPFKGRFRSSIFNSKKDDLTFGIGNPTEYYDRVYLDDYYDIPEEARGNPFITPAVVTAEAKKSGGIIKAQNSAKLISKINQSGANFVKRLLDPNRKSIPDWETKGQKIATHKMSWGEDEHGAYVFPEVQEIDGQLIDFSRPPYASDIADYMAHKNNNIIRMSPEEADWFTRNYKQYYPSFKKGGRIHIKKKNRGKFSEYCGGKVTEECIARGKRSKNPLTRRRANFASVSRKWKHENGGILKYQNPAEPLLESKDTLNTSYLTFKRTLPDNLRLTPEKDYHMYDYWKLNGEPKNFREGKRRGMFTWDRSDKGYHAGSIAEDRNTGIYHFMKPKHHPTVKYELDWFNKGLQTLEGGKQVPVEGKDKEFWEDFKSKYQLDTTGVDYRYVPIQKNGGPLRRPNFKESKEAYYDPETDTVFAPDSLGEFYHHEMFHARPNLQLLESLKPYYHNLNDDILKQMGADLSFVKRFNNDPGHFYSPEELGARIVSASEMLNRMGVKDVTLDFLKNARLNENAYGDNFRDLIHMYNDENLIKIFNTVKKHKNGGILKAQEGTGNLLTPHPLSPVGIALNQAKAMAKGKKDQQHLPPGVKEVVGPDGKKAAIRTERPLVPLEQSIAEWLPGTGDVAEVGYIANDVKNGNYGSAALATAMVALPGNVGKVLRKSDIPSSKSTKVVVEEFKPRWTNTSQSKLSESERLGIPKGERNQPGKPRSPRAVEYDVVDGRPTKEFLDDYHAYAEALKTGGRRIDITDMFDSSWYRQRLLNQGLTEEQADQLILRLKDRVSPENLVVVDGLNSVRNFRRIEDGIPVEMTPERLTFFGRHTTGPGLSGKSLIELSTKADPEEIILHEIGGHRSQPLVADFKDIYLDQALTNLGLQRHMKIGKTADYGLNWGEVRARALTIAKQMSDAGWNPNSPEQVNVWLNKYIFTNSPKNANQGALYYDRPRFIKAVSEGLKNGGKL